MAKTIVDYVGGMRFEGKGQSGHPVVMDASAEVGGSDSAPRPLEAMLCALGGCTGMDVVAILRKTKSEINSLRIEIEDERAKDAPRAIQKLHIVYRVTGKVSEKNLKKAIDLSLSKYCPIAASLAGVAKISSEYRIEKAQ